LYLLWAFLKLVLLREILMPKFDPTNPKRSRSSESIVVRNQYRAKELNPSSWSRKTKYKSGVTKAVRLSRRKANG